MFQKLPKRHSGTLAAFETKAALPIQHACYQSLTRAPQTPYERMLLAPQYIVQFSDLMDLAGVRRGCARLAKANLAGDVRSRCDSVETHAILSPGTMTTLALISRPSG